MSGPGGIRQLALRGPAQSAVPLQSSPIRTEKRQRFDALDALRGISALLVCLFHFPASGWISQNPLVHSSWLFVDFFFLLSGFVLAHSYAPRLMAGMSMAQFTLLRFMRLYPLHLFVLLLFVAVEIVGALWLGRFMDRPAFSGSTSLSALSLNLLLLHSFGLHNGLSWNAPSWSIAAEFWVYLLFALVILRFRHRLNLAALALVIASVTFLFYANANGINSTWRFGFVRCVYGFFLGVIGYSLWRRWGAPTDHLPPSWRSLAEIAGSIVTVALIILLAQGRISLLLPLVFLGQILLFSGSGGLLTRALNTRLLLHLGAWSYGIYMVHAFIQARLMDVLNLLADIGGPQMLVEVGSKGRTMVGRTSLEGDLITIAMLILVIGFAAILYRHVELRGIQYGKFLVARMTGTTA